MAGLELKGIGFAENELKSLSAFLPNSAGADLLNRIMVHIAEEYENILHDPRSNIEQLRFAQGALEYGGKLGMTIKEFIGYVIPAPEEVEGGEYVDGEEAPDVDVLFP